MHVIELLDYDLEANGLGSGLQSCFFSAEKGEVWKLEADNINDSHLFINGLATLAYPSKGTYSFNGKVLNFSDYRHLLSAKKKIGYLTSETTLISNRTIRENLTLNKVYFENNLSPELSDTEMSMCELFMLNTILDVRPVKLTASDIKKAILVRELLKKPDVIIIEFPDEFSGYHARNDLITVLQKAVKSGVILVYSSYDQVFISAFSHKTISIKDGILNQVPLKQRV